MKKRTIMLLSLIFTMLFYSIIASPLAHAETGKGKMQVMVNLTGEGINDNELFTIVVKADDLNNPMPEKAVDGVLEIKLYANQRIDFPDIEFNKIGVYEYTIYQEANDDEYTEYDGTVYKLIAYVTVNEEKELEVSYNLFKGNTVEKHENIVFENKYAKELVEDATRPPEPEPEPPKDEDLIGTGIQTLASVGYVLIAMGTVTLTISRKKE